jgi:hypothetical protein
MRKFFGLVILILLAISPASGDQVRHKIFSESGSSDEGIHLFFSRFIEDAMFCLDRFLKEEEAIKESVALEQKVGLVEKESIFYELRGVKSNVSVVVKPFSNLTSGISRLIKSQSAFLESLRILYKNESDFQAYSDARAAIANMKIAADRIEDSANEIGSIVLWNESSKLSFDVSGLMSRMKEVYELIDYYESLLSKFEREGIIVSVSDIRPFIYQQITISIHAKNVTPTLLFIDDAELPLQERLEHSIEHSFDELGDHWIYAEGIAKGKIVRSNLVKIHVRKISTFIVLASDPAAFVDERVEVKGYISDYYDNPLDAWITAKMDGKQEMTKARNGLFSLNVTKNSEGFLKVSVFYAGDKIHDSSEASITIFFSRFPLSIYLEANRTRVGVNEVVGFKGTVHGLQGLSNLSPIEIFVNSSFLRSLDTAEKFNFTLNFSKSGEYRVHAYFPGDSIHKPARSNEIRILVGPAYPLSPLNQNERNAINWLFISLAMALAIGIGYIRLRGAGKTKKRAIETSEESEKARIVEAEVKKPPKDVEESYRILFSTLAKRYNLKRSFTPRELLKSLADKDFSEELRAVTELHERAVYGREKLRAEEKKRYFKLVEEILEKVS